MIHIYKNIMITLLLALVPFNRNQCSKEEGTTAERPPILVLACL